MKVRIFIESSYRGPRRSDGISMWLVEAKINDVPYTRKGFVHTENGTSTEAELKALINAFSILKKPCETIVQVSDHTIFNTLQNRWHKKWQQDGWIKQNGKTIKHKELWKKLIETVAPHTMITISGETEYKGAMETEIKLEMSRWKTGGKGETERLRDLIPRKGL